MGLLFFYGKPGLLNKEFAVFWAAAMIAAPTSARVEEAARILLKAGLIGLPTETVYGLAADATQDLAVAAIFKAKNRPTFNPLIIHGPSSQSFQEHVLWNDNAEALAQAFWPGPLTLVLPRQASSSLSPC